MKAPKLAFFQTAFSNLMYSQHDVFTTWINRHQPHPEPATSQTGTPA
jgi:hypothetical protein